MSSGKAVKDVGSVRGPFYVVAENAPKLSIFVAVIYMILAYSNIVTHGRLDTYVKYAADALIWTAMFCLPMAIYDVIYMPGSVQRHAHLVLMGFVNYFAILTLYSLENFEKVKEILKYVAYAYLGFFVIALVVFVAYAFAALSREKSSGSGGGE